METAENRVLVVGDKVRINKCESCPKLIGRVVVIMSIFGDSPDNETNLIVNYGRGRPQTGRPEFLSVDNVSLVKVHALGDKENPATQKEVNECIDSLQKE